MTEDQLDKLMPLPKINLVATQGANDEKDLFDACGTKEYRKMLDRQFKNNHPISKLPWLLICGSLALMCRPLLLCTSINRCRSIHSYRPFPCVNRVFDGKDKGLVVDYIGIKK